MRLFQNRALLPIIGVAWCCTCGPPTAYGQDKKPAAPAQAKPPAKAAPPAKAKPPAKPTLDQLLDELSKLDPKALGEHRTKLQAEQKKLTGEIAELKKQVAQREARAAAIKRRIDLLNVLLSKLSKPAAPAKKTAAVMQPATPQEASRPVEKVMKIAMVAARAAKKKPLLNYEQDIKPIVLENCVGCHNPDKSRGGLILDSHNMLMQGGGSGEVVIPGDPDASRLWLLVSHTEKPHMPPKRPRLDDAKLSVIRNWIEQGALRDADSKRTIARKPAMQLAIVRAAPASEAEIPIPVDAPRKLSPPTKHPPAVTALASSPVAPIFAVNGVREALIYDANDRTLLAALPYPEGQVRHLEFSRDGKWLIVAGGQSGASGNVAIFDVVSGKRLGQVAKQYDAVLAAAIDPYRELIAAGGSNKTVRVHDLLTGEVALEIKTHNDWITAVAFSPDATLLATADRSGGLFVWEADTGRQVHILRGHSGAIHDLAFRPDSNVLASAGQDRTVRLWNMDNGKQIKRFNAHSGAVLSLDYAPDGRLCTGGSDGLLKLWKPGGAAMKTFENLGDWVYQARFLDHGRSAIGGTWAGRLDVFDCQSGKRRTEFDTNPSPDTPTAKTALSE